MKWCRFERGNSLLRPRFDGALEPEHDTGTEFEGSDGMSNLHETD